jgi:4-amino-4-deoxy-L-arabinose transferase-like glycosyltransferase
MPLHWSVIQISESLHIDIRWSGMILLMLAVGVAGYFLAKTHPKAAHRYAMPALLLFALPVWGFAWLGQNDIALSLETAVAAWYVTLAAGLASRNHVLIAVGIAGALLSRYTLVFWLPLFAVLLWLHAPRKYSYWIWGSVGAAFLLLFVLPFWMKEPTIISRMAAHYLMCSEGTWLRPDEFSFIDGLGLNMHLREWLPGSPEQNLPYARWPQVGVQLLLAGLGIYYFQKKWQYKVDLYTFSLVALSIMPLLFYSFSPMLFRYYFLMPLCVSAVLCWKAIAVEKQIA